MKKRVLYFDILKAIAIIFVIFIHVISEYWEFLNVKSVDFLVLTIFDSISRFCVPIYFMVSGALFLNEEKKVTIKDVLKKYIPRLLIIYIFWNLAYIFIDMIIDKEALTLSVVGNTILDTLLGKGILHLYFLPIMLGFYLCMPIIKNITKKDNRSILKYLIILLFIFLGFSGPLKYLFNITISYPILFSGYLIYFILGYYLNTFEISKRNTNIIYTLGFIGLLITSVCTLLFSHESGVTEVFFKYGTFNVIMYSSAIFLFAKNNLNKGNSSVIRVLSKTNFGIYLVHGLTLGLLVAIGSFEYFDNMSIIFSVIVNTIFIYIISFACVYILEKIPIIRRLISLEKR